ncbi:MAG: tyrosine-type recombinase/integrase, partial [Candidatus Buchananbacteria bacterium]
MKTTKETLPLLEDFLLSLQSNNYSPETVYNYERDLKVFEHFLIESKFSFAKLERRSIDYYKAYLNSIDRQTAEMAQTTTRLKSYSINRVLSSLRAYLRYLIEMDYKSPILAENVKLVKTERKHPKVGEFNEIVKLIEAPDKLEKNPFVATRNRVMLEILFSTGMRISELINLKKAQIDSTGKIFIMGKGKKERFVYMTPRATHHLKNYLALRNTDSDYLFIPL